MLSIWFRRLGGAWVPGCLQSWLLRTVNYNCTCPTHLSAGCIPVLRGDRQQARSARQANCFTLWLVRTSNTYHVQIQRRLFDILLLHNCRLKIVENHVDPRLVCFPNHLLVDGLWSGYWLQNAGPHMHSRCKQLSLESNTFLIFEGLTFQYGVISKRFEIGSS